MLPACKQTKTDWKVQKRDSYPLNFKLVSVTLTAPLTPPYSHRNHKSYTCALDSAFTSTCDFAIRITIYPCVIWVLWKDFLLPSRCWSERRETKLIRSRKSIRLRHSLLFTLAWCDYVGVEGKLILPSIDFVLFRSRGWLCRISWKHFHRWWI